ncbi:nucleotidyltransferase family protein [Sedimentimonas flavescens]|uniref:nucleotidyltransferase family protein n=1 Tax=Sedimentimonas flavescens TaxID=2851012 RepID=UPI001C4A310D|nr:nucleotidyltransferase family protein [Sedimentimonas flavescens]MBW0158122.1 nucleotidyltransferase family protein [Sedimentimonas flavescens]
MRTTPDALMLFAAGFGTRMGALTANRPKPLIPVAGKALIDHALDLAVAAGMARVVANVHYLGEQVVQHLAGRDVLISDETDEILETGGGLRKALPLLGQGPVFTLNTDAVWSGPNVISTLRSQWDGARMSALLALIPAEEAVGHRGTGDFALDADGRISRGGPYVYTGAQILNPAGIETISETAFSLNRLWDRMIAEGRAYGVLHQGGWCDVGRPESIPLAEAMLERADG